MATPIDPHAGLSRWFVEFHFLPDLLLLTEPRSRPPDPSFLTESRPHPPDTWAALLAEKGFTTDHIEEGALAQGADLPRQMAADAWRTSTWLRLIDGEGLTEPGQVIACIAEAEKPQTRSEKSRKKAKKPRSRTQAVWQPAEAILAGQIKAHYLAADGRPVVDLIQIGADALWERIDEDPWITLCPGLLLAELETLLYLAYADPRYAESLARELPALRALAMRGRGLPPRRHDLLNMTFHADAVTGYFLEHLFDEAAGDDLWPTVTAVQATLSLLVFSNLYEVWPPHWPTQSLVQRYG